MIFGRYIGSDKNFTVGKVYPAKPEFEESMVSFSSLEMIDDIGAKAIVKQKTSFDTINGVTVAVPTFDFEFLEEVYAVVVKPCEDLEVGRVVVVDDAQPFEGDKKDGGKWSRLVYSIKGIGFHSSEYMVLLDRTNIFPGLTILDEMTGKWEQVKSVDECLWVIVDGQKNRRSPDEFRLAVDKEGDIMIEPMVECIDDVGQPNISRGMKYYVQSEEGKGEDRMIYIINDAGAKVRYSAKRFSV
jgi:hypothetical protein